MVLKGIFNMHPFLTIGLWFILGAACGYLALKKGRNPYVWFFIGLIFGLLGILALYIISFRARKKEPEVEIPIKITEINQEPLLPGVQKVWYYLDKNHQQCGPISFQSLQNEITIGEIAASSYVWNEEMENWKQIKDLPHFSINK